MSPGAPTITEALAGEVLFGDIDAQTAQRALLAGVPAEQIVQTVRPGDAAAVEQLRADIEAGRRTLVLASSLIPKRVGESWGPQLYDGARAWQRASRHKKGPVAAFRFGGGIRCNQVVSTLTCIALEVDGTSLAEQARRLDYLSDVHGLRPSLVIMSGDDRPQSIGPLRLRDGVVVSKGKSLHAYFTIQAVGVDDLDHARALKALCVLLRADIAALEHSRLLRAPGVVAGKWGPRGIGSTALETKSVCRRCFARR